MINTKTLVKRLLAKVISKPGVDIFLRSDIKNFLYKYGKELNCPDCDDCCPEPNEIGATVTETVLTFNGSTLSTIPSVAKGFKISPNIVANKRLYGVKIIITGATTQAFSVYDSITELPTLLTNVTPNLFGPITTNNNPVSGEPIESELTITSDGNESANDLSTITVTVKLYTA